MSFDPHGLVSMWRECSYSNGWMGEMVYCLPANEVQQHIIDHWDDTYPIPANVEGQTPNQPMVVVSYRDEPWMDGDVIQSAATDPQGVGGLSNTRKLTYKFGLVYLQSPSDAAQPYEWPDAVARPVFADGTTLKLEMKTSGQFITLPPRAFAIQGAESNTPAMPPNYNGGRVLIPLIDYMIEWDRVADVASLDFTDYIGCVNSKTFMSCEPETLLLESANLVPSFIIDPENGPWSWKVVCSFKRRAISVPAGSLAADDGGASAGFGDGDNTVLDMIVIGWNYDFLPGPPPGWYYMNMASAPGVTGGPRYPLVDFTDLFTLAASSF